MCFVKMQSKLQLHDCLTPIKAGAVATRSHPLLSHLSAHAFPFPSAGTSTPPATPRAGEGN